MTRPPGTSHGCSGAARRARPGPTVTPRSSRTRSCSASRRHFRPARGSGQSLRRLTDGEDRSCPIQVVCHFDADGLSAAAILMRALHRAGRTVAPFVIGRGETPWIAQPWRGRIRDKVLIAASTDHRPGWVYFATRSAFGRNLIDFFAANRPPDADGRYGSGHAQASGGVLPNADWDAFAASLGFPQAKVQD